jgi:hypothetical protein
MSTMPRIVRTRREIIEMVLVSFGFAAGLMLIVWGVSGSVTGREALGIPDEIEVVSPAPNDTQVLSRTEIFVDLIPGLEAELIVNGVTLETSRLGEVEVDPGAQVELPPTAIYDPGNFSIRFQPQEGAAIEEWELGVHNVTVVYWEIEKGRASSSSFSWSFEVL